MIFRSDVELSSGLTPRSDRSELLRLVGLSNELTEIVGCRVDVSTERSLKPEILKSALREAIAL